MIETHEYYESHKNEIPENSEIYHKYKMRDQILNVGRDNQIIYYKNIKFANKKFQEVLQDQFVKLRNHIARDS
jgi:hypothetical protein